MKVNEVQLKTIEEARLPRLPQDIPARQDIPTRQDIPARQDVSARAACTPLEAMILHRGNLLQIDTSAKEQTPRPLPIMPASYRPCPSPEDDTSSDTTLEPPSAAGDSNHPHGGCCIRPRTPSFVI